LNKHVFGPLSEARRLIEAWRPDDNQSRPRSALRNIAPAALTATFRLAQEAA
jgi:putative transposase